MDERTEHTAVFRDTLGQMSHELRTPLTSIMGFAGLLLDDDSITGESREYIKIIDDEARRLADVLRHYVALLMVEQDARERSEDRVEIECAESQ